MSNFPVAKVNTAQNPYQEFTLTIKATANGGPNSIIINYASNYFRVLSLSANTLSVDFGGQGALTSIVGAGIGIQMTDVIPYIRLVNTGAADITVTVALGVGIFNDNRLTVVGTITTAPVKSNTFVGVADVTLNANPKQIMPATATQRSLIITANPANNAGGIRIGGNGSVGAAQGMLLQPGQSIVLDTAAAVFGWASAATDSVSISSVQD